MNLMIYLWGCGNGGDNMKQFPTIYCQKVLPLSYGNSLSYYEDLCKLISKVNDIISELNKIDVNEITQEVLSLVRDELQSEISKVYQYVDNLEKQTNIKFNGVYETISRNYTELDDKYTEITNTLNQKIENLNTLVITLNRNVYTYINQEIERVYDFIEAYQCKTVKCYNPVNGMYEPICRIFGGMYDALRYLGITALDFDSMELTCNSFESQSLSASEFDLYSAYYFHKIKELYMFNPFNGKYMFYQDVIMQLASLHMESPITASEFDGLQLTVTAFASKNITAYDFDNNGKGLLTN